MRAVTPSRSGARMQRSIAACLASILEIDAAEVPVPDERHPDPWTVWIQWLALRGLGLVAIEAPASFNWPGPWLAVLQAADGDGGIGAVAFGSPPGVAWKPLDGPESFDALQAGFVIAPADIALWTSSNVAEPRRAHLERPTAKAGKPGTLRAPIHRGGLRADIVSDGEIEIGDEITAG
jgi:hypothetical protein